MAEDTYARYIRFHTPDIRLSHREQSAMTAEELAAARSHAFMQRSDWLTLLFVPFLLGAALPPFIYLLGGLIYTRWFASGPDVDEALYAHLGWTGVASGLLILCWSLYRIVRARYDVKVCYWKTMPDQGRVDVESHTLTGALNLWSYCFDPDCSTMDRWVDGKLKSVPDSGVSQWLLARTITGEWLVLRHAIEGAMSIMREPEKPPITLQLQPTEHLALAFAPQTNLCLGKRFSGNPMPVAQTSLWLSHAETQHLSEIAHHWQFFYPQRYGVVSQEDARWVDELVQKTQCSIPSIASKDAG